MWGVTVPPESQPMKPEAGRPSATNVVEVTKVAEGQNGNFLKVVDYYKLPSNLPSRRTVSW